MKHLLNAVALVLMQTVKAALTLNRGMASAAVGDTHAWVKGSAHIGKIAVYIGGEN